MDTFLKVLNFLNLLDDSNCISITNLALYTILGKVIFAPAPDWTSIVALVGTLLNYMHKRNAINKSGSNAQ